MSALIVGVGGERRFGVWGIGVRVRVEGFTGLGSGIIVVSIFFSIIPNITLYNPNIL